MSDITFGTVLDECGLSLPDFMGENAAEAFAKVYDKCISYKDALAKTDTENVKKDVPAYRQAWIDNEEAKSVAVDIVTGIVADLDNDRESADWSAALVWHVRDQVRELLGKYLTTEVDYCEYLAEKDLPSDSVSDDPKATVAAKYLAGKKGLANILGLIGGSVSIPAKYVDASAKVPATSLPALPGNYGGNGQAAGRNAKVYTLAYRIDGTEYRNPKDAIRALWSGTSRIGKTTTDLANVLDENVRDKDGKPNVTAITKPVSFTFEGKKVTVWRIAK